MRDARLCGLCGMSCGIPCGIKSLIRNAVRYVRHRPLVWARARTPAPAGARMRTCAGMTHMTHMAHWRGFRAARHAAQVPAQSRARAFSHLSRFPKGLVVVA
jgi:hypothetical protein